MKALVYSLYLMLILAMFIFGYLMGYATPKFTKIPTAYSSQQIDVLIKHNIMLTNIIAEQYQFEQSVAKASGIK